VLHLEDIHVGEGQPGRWVMEAAPGGHPRRRGAAPQVGMENEVSGWVECVAEGCLLPRSAVPLLCPALCPDLPGPCWFCALISPTLCPAPCPAQVVSGLVKCIIQKLLP